jgi:hypothetical protein
MWLNYMNWKSMDECCEINWVHYILGEYYFNEWCKYEYCCDEFPHGKFQLPVHQWMWEHLMNKCHANR